MSKFWHTVIHVGALALQAANVAYPFVPPPYNIVLAAGIGFAQGAVALINHKPVPAIPSSSVSTGK